MINREHGMEKSGAYEVHDAKAGYYSRPIFCDTDDVAIRSFIEAVNTEGHQYGKNPEDYTLWKCGEHDALTGEIEPILRKHLASAFDYVEREDQAVRPLQGGE